jgi:hypothetical protein
MTFGGVAYVAPGPGPLTRTDALGRFAFESIAQDVTLVVPTAEIDSRVEVPYRPGAETKVELLVRRSPTFNVSGQLTNPDAPVSHLVVYLDRSDSLTSLPLTVGDAITDATGRFAISRVPPGPYRLRVGTPLLFTPGAPPTVKYWALVPLDIDRDRSDVVVPLRPGAELRGSVHFAGNRPLEVPPPTVLLHFAVADGPGSTGVIRVDGLRFSTRALFPGRYVLRASLIPEGWRLESAMLNGRDITEVPFDIGAEAIGDIAVTLTDRLTAIDGVVRTATGDGVEADVILFSTNPQHWIDGDRRVRRVFASQRGHFSTTNLPPGEYFVAALPPRGPLRFAIEAKELLHLAGSATRFVLGDGGSVSLSVVRTDN